MRRYHLAIVVTLLVTFLLPRVGLVPSGYAAPSTPEASPVACVQTSEDENEAIARRWHEEALNKGQLDVIDEIAAPGVIHHSVTFADLTGPAGVRQNL